MDNQQVSDYNKRIRHNKDINHPEFALQLAQQAKKEALEKYCFAQVAKAQDSFVREVYKHYHS